MKEFLNDNFLLENEVSVELYHKYAKDLPIFDYHCHLSPKEIAEDKRYKNITELWLGGDHYKWRAMRSNGIDEDYITGETSDYDKFKSWTDTVPYCIGNPLYHWSHLELKRYFDMDTTINPNTRDEIWEKTNAMLKEDGFTARDFIKKSKVKVLCTTDDAIDTLEYHKAIREDESFDVKVLPTLRPDKGLNIDKDTFIPWVNTLSDVSGIKIESYEDFIKALELRVEFFHEEGCRISDHALDELFFSLGSEEEIDTIFRKAMNKEELTIDEVEKYKTATILNLARMFESRDWAMQFHIGAMRNNNSMMFDKLGPDTGFDSIIDQDIGKKLSRLLDEMAKKAQLPKTILYNLNPADNDILGTMIGNFQGDGIPGKIQFGSGWWFNDQKDGMIKQMTSLANLGLLRRFVGMVTDSRSFVSYIRHEYFRRILCNLIGTWVVDGEAPYDMDLLGSMVEEICYYNAVEYFGIEI